MCEMISLLVLYHSFQKVNQEFMFISTSHKLQVVQEYILLVVYLLTYLKQTRTFKASNCLLTFEQEYKDEHHWKLSESVE